MTQEHETFTIVVDRQPTRAGIDPYNKLIDRIPDDNMIDVTHPAIEISQANFAWSVRTNKYVLALRSAELALLNC